MSPCFLMSDITFYTPTPYFTGGKSDYLPLDAKSANKTGTGGVHLVSRTCIPDLVFMTLVVLEILKQPV